MFSVLLQFFRVIACLASAFPSIAAAQAIITVDPATRFQTISGW